MEPDDFAEEIYPGIILVADEALERMCGSPYVKGSLVPNFSDRYEKIQQSSVVWERLLEAYPELEKKFPGAIEEMKRRLFSNHHILLARSVASNPHNFRYTLEHECFERLCESEKGRVDLLALAYDSLFSDEEAPLLIMDLFSGSHYTRCPPIVEFWSQWFRPSFVNYRDLAILVKLKARARGLANDNVQAAIRWVEDAAGCRVKKEVEEMLAGMRKSRPNDGLSKLSEKEKILIVDDEIGMCEVLREVIEDAPAGRFQVDHATNATRAMDLIREKAYDLVFVDIKLNGSSGIDVLKECRLLDAPPKIVIHSVLSPDSQYPVFMREGVADMVTDYLDKNNDLSIPDFLNYITRIVAVKGE